MDSRIADVRLDRLRLPLDPPFHAAWDPVPRRAFDATLVTVTTRDGIVGHGSGDSMEGFAGHEHLFLGEDALAMARHVAVLETIAFHGGRCWPLEAALWDVVGKVAGLPVAALFGGARDRVPVYASTGELKDPEQRAEQARGLVASGVRAMKVRIDRDHVDRGVAVVAAVREAVGADLEVMVDLNQSWRTAGDVAPASDLATVRRTVARLAELDVFWVEEPLPYADVDGFRRLRADTGVRVAAGEMVQSVPEVLRLLEADALDVYQMDVVLSVGMLRCRTLAEVAAARHRQFTPHTWTNGLGVLANLHVAAGVGAGPYLEYPLDPPGWTPERRDFLLSEPLSLDADGCLRVPDAPGLGARPAPDLVPRFGVAPEGARS